MRDLDALVAWLDGVRASGARVTPDVCARFAADAVVAQGLPDPARGLRREGRTVRGAAEVLARHGGLAGLAAARLGEEVPPALARRGDVALVEADGAAGAALCVVGYDRLHALDGEGRLLDLPLTLAVRAWRAERTA